MVTWLTTLRIELASVLNSRFEPPRDKTSKMSERPAKTQISLGIRSVWSESSLYAQWVAKDPSFLHADSEGSFTVFYTWQQQKWP